MTKIKLTLFAMMIATGIQAQGVMDVHSHIITPEFVSALEQEGRLMDEGFPLPKYDVAEHLKWMDEAGIETSVLTLAAPQPTSAEVVRKTNEAAARIKKEHPGRFLFCAALPLPDVNGAIKEVKYALDVLKADGIKLATNVNEQYLGAPELDTLFAFLNERKAVVILHPHRPEPVNKQVMAQTPLAMQEYLSETTRAIANMISRNVLARYPNVKVVVPHCGAYLPLAVPRMKSLTPVMQAKAAIEREQSDARISSAECEQARPQVNKMVGEIDWEANLRTLYYDLAGAHSPETIRMMFTITTPDHLLYGSDYPYVQPQVLIQSLARMKDYLSKEPDLAPFREMILMENARKLWNLSSKTDNNIFKRNMEQPTFESLNSPWPKGEPNTGYAQYFIGNSYLANVGGGVNNVTFEPRCRNNWHIHHKQVQVLICVSGRGWYQEWGKPAVEMTPGTVIAIPAEVKHWHGAAKDSWFQHLTYHKDVQEGASNEWLEPVTDEIYNKIEINY